MKYVGLDSETFSDNPRRELEANALASVTAREGASTGKFEPARLTSLNPSSREMVSRTWHLALSQVIVSPRLP